MMMTVASATAGMTWLDGFLAQAKATSEAARKIAQPLQLPDNATPDQMRAHAADMRRFIEETRQNVNKQIASGNVIGFDAPATAQHNIPETVDGVETGFLNSRHITLEYLNRAEDLVENHPDVAAKVFDQGDSMHRFILTMVKNQDFDSGMETYTDATDRQYAAEGDKVAVSGMLSDSATSTACSIPRRK
jgi:hypothetical protein